jgi:hypothetical protein
MGFVHDDCLPGTAGYRMPDDEACGSYGLTFGTPEFAQCMMQKDANRGANRAFIAGALLNNPAFFGH